MLPRKKRRLTSYTYLEDIAAEVDLEIALRERLQYVTQQRIKWAQALLDGHPIDDTPLNENSAEFKTAALDAWDAVNHPIAFLLDRDVSNAPSDTYVAPRQSDLNGYGATGRTDDRVYSKDVVPVRPRKPKFLYIRSSKGSETDGTGILILRCPACLRTSFTSLQGILNHARLAHKLEWGTHDDCIKACAVDNQEGLLIEEGIEVGGNLSVLPSLQRLFHTALSAQDNQVGPTLPAPSDATGAFAEQANGTKMEGSAPAPLNPQSTHISRTLGYHVDTPALAPFLGRTARRRGIQSWHETSEVDVYGGTEVVDEDRKRARDRRSRLLRNDACGVDDVDATDANTVDSPPDGSCPAAAIPFCPSDVLADDPLVNANRVPVVCDGKSADLSSLQVQSSRFHFSTRVIITDRSWYIPSERRDDQNHTHRWMISVEAPSYSLDITSILKALRVTQAEHQPSVSDTIPPTLPLICDDPPFVVVGWTSHPFLAKIELQFNGIGEGTDAGQVTTLEHWVELDQLGMSHPVTGDEQVVDVELDKRMRILPARKDCANVNAKSLWNMDPRQKQGHQEATYGTQAPDAADGLKKPEEQDIDKVLQEIVPKFPMTQKDIKSRSRVSSQVPYKLVASPAQFKALIMGRRKAIEWGRARAIRDAFRQEIQAGVHQKGGLTEGAKELSTAEVYTWLENQGLFIRDHDWKPSHPKADKVPIHDDGANRHKASWCGYCGLELDLHPPMHISGSCISLAGLSRVDEYPVLDPSHRASDPRQLEPISTLKLPMVDIHPLLNPSSLVENATGKSTPDSSSGSYLLEPRAIVATTDPRLTMGIMNVVSKLKLPSFQCHLADSPFPLDRLGRNTDDVLTRLAPYATIVIVLKRVVRILIQNALQVAQEDKDRMSLALAQNTVMNNSRREDSTKLGAPLRRALSNERRALTASHVLRGIMRWRNDNTKRNNQSASDAWAVETRLLYLCFADMGVILDSTSAHRFTDVFVPAH